MNELTNVWMKLATLMEDRLLRSELCLRNSPSVFIFFYVPDFSVHHT